MRTASEPAPSKVTPLVVDLDHTLLKTDTLFEAFVAGLFRKPRATIRAFCELRRGRAALKAAVADLDVLDPDHLPLRQELLAWLKEQHAAGRELHLISAAWHDIVERVAGRVGMFAGALGSADGVNLKGRIKAEALASRFPDGFAYAGDSAADLHVWQKADSIVLVAASRDTARKARAIGKPVENEFRDDRRPVRDWMRAMRLHQWAKNLLIFVPLILAHQYRDVTSVVHCLLGFLALGLVASGTYLINDLHDVVADRLHRTKCRRPIASGAISPLAGLAGSLILIALGLALTVSGGLSGWFGLTLVAYLVLTLSYSFRFKREPMIDVFILGLLYTLRIFMGLSLISAPVAPWLLVFSTLFFYSLSMAKRHVEVVRAAAGADDVVTILGRGYRTTDMPLTLALGIGTGVASVLVMFLYIVNDAFPAGAYRSPQWLWAIGFMVFLWLTRVWLFSHRALLDDDPVVFALKDKVSLGMAAAVGVAFGLAIL